MSGHELASSEPDTVRSIDAEYLSGKRFPYQEDIALLEDVDLLALTAGDDLNRLEDVTLLVEDGMPAVFDRYSNSFLKIYFPIPEGYVVEKGSITVDGVSLTVAARLPDAFTVALIPHTMEVTTLGPQALERPVNLEVDVVAKYVESLAAPYAPEGTGG